MPWAAPEVRAFTTSETAPTTPPGCSPTNSGIRMSPQDAVRLARHLFISISVPHQGSCCSPQLHVLYVTVGQPRSTSNPTSSNDERVVVGSPHDQRRDRIERLVVVTG